MVLRLSLTSHGIPTTCFVEKKFFLTLSAPNFGRHLSSVFILCVCVGGGGVVFFIIILTNYCLERRLYVKLKD